METDLLERCEPHAGTLGAAAVRKNTAVAKTDAPEGRADRRTLAVSLLAYTAIFAALHQLAAVWAGSDIYSLWYPAAGARFVFLWRLGPRFGLGAAAAELVANTMLGAFTGKAPALALMFAASIVATPLAYTAVVALVQRRARLAASLPPLPMAIAAVLGPLAASLASLTCWVGIEALSPPAAHADLIKHYAAAAVTFILGDLLGLLLIAQPLLLLLAPRRNARGSGRAARWLEHGCVAAAGWAAVWAVSFTSPALLLEPLLIAVAWIAVRGGSWAAWTAVVASGAGILAFSAAGLPVGDRLALHLQLAVMAIIGLLLGSLSDAEARLRHSLAQRDRVLYQAERLKTLRAMSLAIIHEISQPLSTLAIEARQLRRLAQEPSPGSSELCEASGAVERQTARLSAIVSRLRGFGSRGAAEHVRLLLGGIAQEVAALAEPEARKAQLKLEIEAAPDLAVTGNAVELQQAVLNLVRNAIAAAKGKQPALIRIVVDRVSASEAVLAVEDFAPDAPSRRRADGMGLGLNIARAIIDAHRGTLSHRLLVPQGRRYEIRLPLLGAKS